MNNLHEFLKLVLDSITEHIVVINDIGEIQFTNKSWSTFGSSNGPIMDYDWNGVNYIKECDKASAMGDEFGTLASAGIRSVIENRESLFSFEYPCHSADEKRWFMMRTTPFEAAGVKYFVISHQDITERKLVEEEVRNLARLDGLTNIANRRTFDAFLQTEWNRCARFKQTICLAIVDLDHFKLLNDHYGHQSGDECLIQVGKVLKKFAKRPGDICARYGGEEFVLVWGNTSLEQAKTLAQCLLNNIESLNIEHQTSLTKNHLTVSIGLAEMIPLKESEGGELIDKADRMLYKAKDMGRNRVEY